MQKAYHLNHPAGRPRTSRPRRFGSRRGCVVSTGPDALLLDQVAETVTKFFDAFAFFGEHQKPEPLRDLRLLDEKLARVWRGHFLTSFYNAQRADSLLLYPFHGSMIAYMRIYVNRHIQQIYAHIIMHVLTFTRPPKSGKMGAWRWNFWLKRNHKRNTLIST